MVLHKSKWDHKAKISYLKKHGLTRPKQAPQITPKWSSKKTSSEPRRTINFDDSDDSDWDSEDEDLLNHFYPEIAEQNIPVEQKFKIKRQIINGLREKVAEEQQDGDHEGAEALEEEDEMGGIYLGTQPDEEIELPELDAKLADFVITDLKPSKNRKLLKNKILDNLLEDYGISSYKETVGNANYNESKMETNVERLTADDLHGLRIGESDDLAHSNIRTLTAEEKQEHIERSKKLESAKLYEQMKKKFGDSTVKAKVLEINNFNADDQRQMDVLNLKLTQTNEKVTLDDDLDVLLGGSGEPHSVNTVQNVDLDSLLKLASEGNRVDTTKKTQDFQGSKVDEDFLDDLLG